MGSNDDGQLGDGTTIDRPTPVKVMSNVQAISAGFGASFFLKTDGTVWATGYGLFGRFGDGMNFPIYTRPRQIMSGVKAISATGSHSLLLTNGGDVWAAGYNSSGQLGNGSSADLSNVFVKVMSNVKSISTGRDHSLFLTTNGDAWAAGDNADGQLGDGTFISRNEPMKVMSDVEDISAGYYHSMFLKTDRNVMSCGFFPMGSIEISAAPKLIIGDVTTISAGSASGLFLKRDGSVWAAGANGDGQCGVGAAAAFLDPLQVMDSVESIAAGATHNLFLKSDGSVWGAGSNNDGELGLGSGEGKDHESLPVFLLNLVSGINLFDKGLAWQEANFGTDISNPEIAGWDADPDHDGVTNLLECAFNLPPLEAGSPVLAADTGIRGLPLVRTQNNGYSMIMNIQYIRLKIPASAGINYIPEISENLSDWLPLDRIESIESIDEQWERVTIPDIESYLDLYPARFVRIRVTRP